MGIGVQGRQHAMKTNNIFNDIQTEGAERFDDLVRRPGVRIERIVSAGQVSPPGFWYDQGWDEWVLMVAGSALLRFVDESGPRCLRPGDHVFIGAHRRHRVEETQADPPTVWLAVHIGEPDSA